MLCQERNPRNNLLEKQNTPDSFWFNNAVAHNCLLFRQNQSIRIVFHFFRLFTSWWGHAIFIFLYCQFGIIFRRWVSIPFKSLASVFLHLNTLVAGILNLCATSARFGCRDVDGQLQFWFDTNWRAPEACTWLYMTSWIFYCGGRSKWWFCNGSPLCTWSFFDTSIKFIRLDLHLDRMNKSYGASTLALTVTLNT